MQIIDDEGEEGGTVTLKMPWQEFNHLIKVTQTVGQEYRYLSAPGITQEEISALKQALHKVLRAVPDSEDAA